MKKIIPIIFIFMLILNNSFAIASPERENGKKFLPINIKIDCPHDVFYALPFKVKVNITNNWLPPIPFKIVVFISPSKPASWTFKVAYTKIIGVTTDSIKLKPGETQQIEIECRAGPIQSVGVRGYIGAMIMFCDFLHPADLKWDIVRYIFNRYVCEYKEVNIHNPIDELARITITNFSLEKRDGKLEVRAGESINAMVQIKNTCGLDIDNASVEIRLVKPSAVGLGVFQERVTIGKKTLLLKAQEERESPIGVIISCHIPPDTEEGWYETEALIKIPFYGVEIPGMPTKFGERLHVIGKEKTFITDKQLNKIFYFALLLIPLLFIAGILFSIAKRYIHEYISKKRK